MNEIRRGPCCNLRYAILFRSSVLSSGTTHLTKGESGLQLLQPVFTELWTNILLPYVFFVVRNMNWTQSIDSKPTYLLNFEMTTAAFLLVTIRNKDYNKRLTSQDSRVMSDTSPVLPVRSSCDNKHPNQTLETLQYSIKLRLHKHLRHWQFFFFTYLVYCCLIWYHDI